MYMISSKVHNIICYIMSFVINIKDELSMIALTEGILYVLLLCM